jgi:CubicO group peptidase (beta-lactamase class C family)
VASRRVVTPQTTFNVYSITKPFTAAAVLALAQAGRLDLNEPVGAAAGVDGLGAYGTVQDTLLHRAGFQNPNPLRWIHLAEEHAGFDEAAFVRERVSALRGTHPGWRRSGYSNLGYLLLGLAIERASVSRFTSSLGRLVFDALSLELEDCLGFEIADPSRHANGHFRRYSLVNFVLGLLVDRRALVGGETHGWVELRLHQVNGSAYGGLLANARGLVRFGQAVLGTPPGFSASVRQRLLEIVPGPGPRRTLGFVAGGAGRRRWLAHAGGGLGAYGELRLYPDLHAVSALLTNGPGLADVHALDRLDETWLGGASA